jgi:hypothetical protein
MKESMMEKGRRKKRGSRSLLGLLVSAGLRRLVVRVSLHSLLSNDASVRYPKDEMKRGEREKNAQQPPSLEGS